MQLLLHGKLEDHPIIVKLTRILSATIKTLTKPEYLFQRFSPCWCFLRGPLAPLRGVFSFVVPLSFQFYPTLLIVVTFHLWSFITLSPSVLFGK
jgi:hypothetical protein